MKRTETSAQSDQVNLKVPEELSSNTKPILVPEEISDSEIQQSSSHSVGTNEESETSETIDWLEEKTVIGDENIEDGVLIQPEMTPNLAPDNESAGTKV